MSDAEIIDVVDEDGQVVGTITRAEAESGNHTIQNALVFIFNSKGRVWLQLRAKTKNHYPGLWDISACGGVLSGESPDEAAVRETLEETGLEVTLQHVDSFLNVFPGDSGEERRRMSHLYIGVSDETPQINDEVEAFKEWDIAELKADALRHEDQYVPSFMVELDMAVKAHNVDKNA